MEQCSVILVWSSRPAESISDNKEQASAAKRFKCPSPEEYEMLKYEDRSDGSDKLVRTFGALIVAPDWNLGDGKI